MKPLFIVLLVALAGRDVSAQRPTTASAAIHGQVIGAHDGVPLRRARVVVAVGARQAAATLTDDEGRFVITDAPSGTVTVTASKARFTITTTSIVTGPNTPPLELKLAPSGAVTGRVTTPAGALLPGVFVTARRVLPETDRRLAAEREFFVQTDRLGEFRLGRLPAGRFEVAAHSIPPASRPTLEQVRERLFAGRGRDIASSESVTLVLEAGEERRTDFLLPESNEECAPGPTRLPPAGTVTATISGRVMSSAGAPLACAIVQIETADASIPQVRTDARGHYSIESVPPGSFVVSARRPDYVTMRTGQQNPQDAPVPITVRRGEQRNDVDLILPHASMLTGTVTDEHGEPMEGVGVTAMQVRRTESSIVLASQVLGVTTNDLGQYRLIGVAQGSYVVSVRPRGSVSHGDGGFASGYTTTFYPGASELNSAQRVMVETGRNVDGLDITLSPTRTATVSGVVFGPADRTLPGPVMVSASRRSGGPMLDTWSAIAQDGRFTIRNLPLGDYVVKAMQSASGTVLFGLQYLSVADAQPAPVAIALAVQANVEGRVTLEHEASADARGIVVSASSADPDGATTMTASAGGSDPSFSRTASTLEDSRFRIMGVTGPTRFLVTTPSCETCYVKSITVNAREATHTPFDFGIAGGVFRDVEIVVSDRGGTLEGRTDSARGDPATDFWAIAIPTDRGLWYPRSSALKAARSRPDGTFRLVGLPPGDYHVIAVDQFDSSPSAGELVDIEVLESLARLAGRVTVVERDHHRQVDLPLVRR